MTQNRKYFGMTTTQLAILGGLAGTACLLFGIVGILLLRGLNKPARAPQNTPVPLLTATPFVLPTLAPTGTPTPVPYELLIPEGWDQFKTALVEIWLPKGFKQEKPKPSDSASPELALIGTVSETSLNPVIVMIYYEPLAAGSLDTYVDVALGNLPAEDRVVEKKKININSVDAFRAVIETRIDNIDANAMIYILPDGGTVWTIFYFAQINDFYAMLDTFEKSVKTFRPVR